MTQPPELIEDVLLECKQLVIRRIHDLIAEKRFRRALSARLAEYPIREGKGLRPALCLASCQAFGGKIGDAINTAVALELFHNAFLVHDDIEDESIHRRGDLTIHEKYGTAIAINVGDALYVLALTPLLKNLETIGLKKTLQIFGEIENMARQSVEGQAMELEWVKANHWDLSERDYALMSYKKTCWYTCITPLRLGVIIAGNNHVQVDWFNKFGRLLGIAFQIQDDILNLVGAESLYGKESCGDIWEGKRTIMLIHLLSSASTKEKARIARVLSRARDNKTPDDVNYIVGLMCKYKSIEHGADVALRYAQRAQRLFDKELEVLPETRHKAFLREMVRYVVEREL